MTKINILKHYYQKANPALYSTSRYHINYYSVGEDQFAIGLDDSAMPRRVLITGFPTTDEAEAWVANMRGPDSDE